MCLAGGPGRVGLAVPVGVLAALAVVLDRDAGDLARVRRLGLARFEAAVRRGPARALTPPRDQCRAARCLAAEHARTDCVVPVAVSAPRPIVGREAWIIRRRQP
jgi:hypothetical protein